MDISVLDFLNSIIPISENLKIRLESILRTAEFKKKTVLLKEGQVSNYIYFIESGLIRIYYIKEDKEICSGLICEGGLAISVKSFFNREKSDEFIETIEDTRAQYISFQELEQLYTDFPEFNIVGRRLITQYYVKSEDFCQIGFDFFCLTSMDEIYITIIYFIAFEGECYRPGKNGTYCHRLAGRV